MKSFLSVIVILSFLFTTCEKKPPTPTLEDVEREYMESDDALPPDDREYPFRLDKDLLVEKKYSFLFPLAEIKAGNVRCKCGTIASAYINQKNTVYLHAGCMCYFRTHLLYRCPLRIKNANLEGYNDEIIDGNYCYVYCFNPKLSDLRKSEYPTKQEKVYFDDIYKQIETSIAKERFCREKIKETKNPS